MRITFQHYRTLADALNAEGIADLWPTDLTIEPGHHAKLKTADGRVIIINRHTDGRYDNPTIFGAAFNWGAAA
ncbi:hypothetical protein U5801_21410 [Lamprobacter modestohalophilus]|uniref:hypothetical protein n=1 Tax=Lamprobacter modestohalophilus TaxID=1064514 RepID=UPI002ADEA86B|nr:hypothetical protein [Lamprobacter modestohalophilus]MEA1052343.1 hypothetical protein [Lamprobacter modestohalophilus]